MPGETGAILCLNAGSSSLKFALYEARGLREPDGPRGTDSLVMSGSAQGIGPAGGRLRIEVNGRVALSQEVALPTHEEAVREALAALNQLELPIPSACVHRIAHGGPRLVEPALITSDILGELRRWVGLAPLHIPDELAVIEAAVRAYPATPQIACFDTSFHQRMPDVAKRLPLPRRFWDEGIRRYGFHGLSFESIVSQLGGQLAGRSIIAHLGSGCSLVALLDGAPRDTTMGLTPTGGLMMGTRSGDLDPGVVLSLPRSATPAKVGLLTPDLGGSERLAALRLLNTESGLLGVSGISGDMEALLQLEAESIPAREAIELFCYGARKAVGALAAALGGLDTLVFTGGIGENSAVVRSRICEGLGLLGVWIDSFRNGSNAPVISRESAGAPGCVVRVLHTDENRIMARHAERVLSLPSAA